MRMYIFTDVHSQ